MQLNLLGKAFFAAVGAALLQKGHTALQADDLLNRLRPLARSTDWVAFNKVLDATGEPCSRADREALWFGLREGLDPPHKTV